MQSHLKERERLSISLSILSSFPNQRRQARESGLKPFRCWMAYRACLFASSFRSPPASPANMECMWGCCKTWFLFECMHKNEWRICFRYLYGLVWFPPGGGLCLVVQSYWSSFMVLVLWQQKCNACHSEHLLMLATEREGLQRIVLNSYYIYLLIFGRWCTISIFYYLLTAAINYWTTRALCVGLMGCLNLNYKKALRRSIHACVRKLKVKIRYERAFLRRRVPTPLRTEIFGIPKQT